MACGPPSCDPDVATIVGIEKCCGHRCELWTGRYCCFGMDKRRRRDRESTSYCPTCRRRGEADPSFECHAEISGLLYDADPAAPVSPKQFEEEKHDSSPLRRILRPPSRSASSSPVKSVSTDTYDVVTVDDIDDAICDAWMPEITAVGEFEVLAVVPVVAIRRRTSETI